MEPLDQESNELGTLENAPLPMPEDQEPVVAPLVAPMPGENLIKRFTVTGLKSVATRVLQTWQSDYDSGEGWRQQVAGFNQLYNGDIPPAASGGKNIIPVHLPYSTRAVQIFSSKLFENLYPPDREIVAVSTRDPDLQEDAFDASEHMNDQLMVGIKDYRKNADRSLNRCLIEGCIFEAWKWDAVREMPASKFYRADDMAVPYKHEFTAWDMSDFPRVGCRERYYIHELAELEHSGYYACVTKPERLVDGEQSAIMPEIADAAGMPISGADAPKGTEITEVDDANIGQKPSNDDPEGSREIREQDCYLRIPGDSAFRFVTVCIDFQSSTVLSIRLCEKPDPRDMARFMRDLNLAETARTSQVEAMIEQAAAAGMDPNDPNVQQAAEAAIERPAPPPSPRTVPWHRFTQYCCFENPGGAYGHGLLHRTAGFNILANQVATRGVSAMTASLLPTGLKSRGTTIGTGQETIEIGKFLETNLSPRDLENGAGLKVFQYPAPDANWHKIIEMCDKSCQELSAYNVAAGGQGMSGETATEVETRNTNAHDTISMVANRYNAARAVSLMNLVYLNSIYLPEDGVELANGNRITRETYQRLMYDMRVLITCDPRIDSQSIRERRAQKGFDVLNQVLSGGAIGEPIVDKEVAQGVFKLAGAHLMKEMRLPQKWIDSLVEAPIPQPPMMPTQGPPGGPPNGPPPGAGPDAGPPPGGPEEQPGEPMPETGPPSPEDMQ